MEAYLLGLTGLRPQLEVLRKVKAASMRQNVSHWHRPGARAGNMSSGGIPGGSARPCNSSFLWEEEAHGT